MDATSTTLPTLISTADHLITWMDRFDADFPTTHALALVDFLTYCRLPTDTPPILLFGESTTSDRPMPLYFCSSCGSYLQTPHMPHILCPSTDLTADAITRQTNFLSSIHHFIAIHVPEHNTPPLVLSNNRPHTPADMHAHPSTSLTHTHTQTSPASTAPYEDYVDISDTDDNDNTPSPAQDDNYLKTLISQNNIPPRF